MLGFLDNGFFIFLIIALLSAVSEWLTKRRAAKNGDSVPVPPHRQPRPNGPQPEIPGEVRRSEKKSVPSLFEHLEKELRKLADDQPVVEVLDEPKSQPTRQQPVSTPNSLGLDSGLSGASDPVQVQQRKLAEIEQKKKEAAQKLNEVRLKADKTRKQANQTGASPQFVGFGTNARQIRQWVRHRKQLRSAIVLNTLLETPKGLQTPGSDITGT